MDGPSRVPKLFICCLFSCEIRCHTAHINRVLCGLQHLTTAESKVQHNLDFKILLDKNTSCWEQKDLLCSKKIERLKDRICLQTTHSTHGLKQTWEEYQSAVTLDDPSTRVTVSGATEANTSRVKSWMRRTPLQCQHFIL